MNQNPRTCAPANPRTGTSEPAHPRTREPAPRTTLITGASAGIGAAFAEVFAAEGWNVVLVARRRDRLDALAARLTESYGIAASVIAADLGDPQAPGRLVEELVARQIHVDALVNNAGYGVPGSYVVSPWARHAAMLQVMVNGLAELTYRLLPPMLERGYGRIVNVASLAGLVPAPGGHTLYAATKAFLIKFSESLGHEVRARGIHVTALCPGFTYSEFHDVTGTREQMKRLPPWLWMDSATVARQGYDAVMAGNGIYVNGRVNQAIAALVTVAPGWLIRAVERRLGHRKL